MGADLASDKCVNCALHSTPITCVSRIYGIIGNNNAVQS